MRQNCQWDKASQPIKRSQINASDVDLAFASDNEGLTISIAIGSASDMMKLLSDSSDAFFVHIGTCNN